MVAFRLAGDADATTMGDESVREVDPFLSRNDGHQVGFDFHGIVVRCEAKPATEAADVGVDDDASRFAEGDAEDDVGGLTADAGEVH